MRNTLQRIVFLSLLIGLFSCSNNKVSDTIGEVRVLDEKGEVFPNADITIDCFSSINQTCDLHLDGISDESGLYVSQFLLPATYRVVAKATIFDTTIIGVLPDTAMTIIPIDLCGQQNLVILPEELTKITITLSPCK